MRLTLLIFFFAYGFLAVSQSSIFPEHLQKTQIARLQSYDSLTYYQCHVDEASQELTTSSGQKITSKKRRVTITEKFVIVKKDSTYSCRYYTSPITNYPNKKFPYLTLKEVANWNFELQNSKTLNREETLLAAAMETKTHAIINYDLNINKSCPNEVIICYKKNREQLIVEGDYLLSKLLKCN
jgi:hypothetical protein